MTADRIDVLEVLDRRGAQAAQRGEDIAAWELRTAKEVIANLLEVAELIAANYPCGGSWIDLRVALSLCRPLCMDCAYNPGLCDTHDAPLDPPA